MLSRMRGMRRCPEKALAGQGRKHASRCRVDSCIARRRCSAERSQTKRTSRWTVSPRAPGVRPSRPSPTSTMISREAVRRSRQEQRRAPRLEAEAVRERVRGVPSSGRRRRLKRPDTHVRLVVERLTLITRMSSTRAASSTGPCISSLLRHRRRTRPVRPPAPVADWPRSWTEPPKGHRAAPSLLRQQASLPAGLPAVSAAASRVLTFSDAL